MEASSPGEESKQRWILIQLNTFTNWLNQQLKGAATVRDLRKDLCDGVLLIHIIETLQGKQCVGKIYTENPTEIQCLMNVQMALDALREDGLRLVNIGSHDVVNGNIKLVLGLVWSLIQRYHISSRTKIPPKKLMMAWIQSVLPELTITNFRTNWNDGRALSALLEYCQPGLCPEWRALHGSDRRANCERALSLAQTFLGIPRIISSDDLSSTELDELSCLTYLSYFMRKGGPGYAATLQRVRQLLSDPSIRDFCSSWSDGVLLGELIEEVGGVVDLRYPSDTRLHSITNIRTALLSAEKLGVKSLLSAEDIADSHNEHLGVMAMVAALCSLSKDSADFPPTQCYQNQQVNLDLAFAEGDEVRVEELTVEVLGPGDEHLRDEEISLRKSRTRSGALLSLLPSRVGSHQVRIACGGRELPSSPLYLQVLPLPPSLPSSALPSPLPPSLPSPLPPSLPASSPQPVTSFAEKRAQIVQKLEAASSPSGILRVASSLPPPLPAAPPPPPPPPEEMPATGLVSFSGLSDPCPVGSIVEVVINAHGEPSRDSLVVEAKSPSGKTSACHVSHAGRHYTAAFTPHQVGTWKIGILYEGEHIKESPFDCKVFDSDLVSVYGLDVGLVGQQLKFNVKTWQAGSGQLEVSVLHLGSSVPASVAESASQPGLYTVCFVPEGAGQYNIHVLFNKIQVKGSPFILDIADASSVSVYGENLRVASVDKLATFVIHAAGADPKDITVAVTAPSGKQRLARVDCLDAGTLRAEWKPVEAGEHSIDVRLFDQSVYESPFICNVGDAELVTVRGMPRQILKRNLGQDHSFEIDASAAGSGNLEIMINGGRVPCRVRELGSRQYLALFTPTQTLNHIVEMRFNGEEVRGSPWNIAIEEHDRMEISRHEDRSVSSPRSPSSFYSELSGPGLVRASVGRLSTFDITGDRLEAEHIRATVTTPEGRELPVRVLPKGIGKFAGEYRIDEVGEHQLNVWIAGRKVDTSPLFVAGYSAERVKLEPLGGGAPGQPVQFIVDAVEAGKGQLEISVNQGRVPNNVQMQGAGRCLVTFIPQQPGSYVIDVTFNGELVHGCPIRVEILPKQVGEAVTAPIHHTTTQSTTREYSSVPGIAGGPPPSGYGGTTSPTSPTLLRHVRQRSSDGGEGQLKSPSLMRAIDRAASPRSVYTSTSRYESSTATPKWTPSAVEAGRASSFSPRRSEWTESSSFHEGAISPTSTVRTAAEATERSRAPPTEISFTSESRTLGQPTAYRSRSSPTDGERVRRVEEMDPLADEAERESRRSAWQREQQPERTLGFTVAQYGEPKEKRPEIIELDYSRRPFKEPETRTGNGHVRRESPTYSSVYEREEARGATLRQEERRELPRHLPPPTRDIRPPSPPRDFSPPRQESADADKVPFHTSYTEEKKTFRRSISPVDYGTRHESSHEYRSPHMYVETEKERTVSPSGDEVVETTTTKTTTYSVSPRPRDAFPVGKTTQERSHLYENVDRRPALPRRHSPEEGADGMRRVATERDTSGERPPPPLIPSYTRTQSASYVDHDKAPKGLARSDEVERIYDQPPSKLAKASELAETELSERERRTAEYLKTKEEDDRILEKHGFRRTDEPMREQSRERSTEEGRKDEREGMGERERRDSREDWQRDDGHGNHRMGAEADGRMIGLRDEVEALSKTDEMPHSPPVSTPNTPKMSSKFKRVGEGRLFDFGKSKFTSKHEVVKRGKEVDVKLESLKLAKEDTLRVVVMAPLRAHSPGDEPTEIEPKVKKSGNKYEICFKPTDVGTHKVFAYVNEVQHPLSPFAVRVYDPSEILVGDIPLQSALNDSVEFTVDAGRAGFGNLEMAIKDADGVIIPSHVAQLESGSARFLVTFTPANKGPHTVNITFNKEVLKSSPYEVLITDPPATSQLSPVSGSSLPPTTPELTKRDMKREKEEKKREEKEKAKREKEEKAATLKKEKELKKLKKGTGKAASVSKIPSLSRVGVPSAIQVHTIGDDSLEITVTDAKKEGVDTNVKEMEAGLLQIEFTPQHVGDHEIDVKYGGIPVAGSPFTCRAYDPANIRVGAIPNGVVERPVHFVVDASEAGVGNLEVAVNDGKIPSMANGLGQHRYDISFIPREQTDHFISVRFNNEPVPGSPFVCRLVSATHVTAAGPGLERVAVDEDAHFSVHTQGESITPPSVSIRGPHGSEVTTSVKKEDGDLFDVSYVPKTVGNYVIEVEHEKEPVPGSPFTAKAFDARLARLTPSQEAAELGRPTHFSIDAANAGAGNMEIIVSVNGRNVPNFVQSEGQAKFRVSFTPQEAKEHHVSVKFNGSPVPGSPMRVDVQPRREVGIATGPSLKAATTGVGVATGPSLKAAAAGGALLRTSSPTSKQQLDDSMQTAQVGQKKGFSIPNVGRGDCNVIVTDANGGPLPVRCYKQQDDSYWVEFTPEHIGIHTIDVTFGETAIAGSPFKCSVVDPKKVVVSGIDDSLVLRQGATVCVSREGAGVAELTVEVADPAGLPLKTEALKSPRGEDRFTFLPSKIGPHKVSVKLGGFQVPGFPRSVYVDEQLEPCLTGTAMKNGVEEGGVAALLFDPRGHTGGIKIHVTDPSGSKVQHTVQKKSNGISEINFTAEKVGIYKATVDFNNVPISGSPFRVEVFDPRKVADSRDIVVRGMEKGLTLRHAATISVDRSGLGRLEVDVRDPSGHRVKTEQLKSPTGQERVTFLPSQIGAYKVDVRLSGVSISGYPQTVMVEEAATPSLVGAAVDLPVRLGDPATFIFDPKHETGGLKVDVRAPDGKKVRHTTDRRQNGTTEVLFYPEQVGKYNVNVDFNSRPVTGSPLTVRVVDPSKVLVNDENMDRQGRLILSLGQKNHIDVDVTAAGPGKLRAEVEDADSRVVSSGPVVEEVGHGKMRVAFTPRTPGVYNLFLRYGELPVEDAHPLKALALPAEEASRVASALPTTSTRHMERDQRDRRDVEREERVGRETDWREERRDDRREERWDDRREERRHDPREDRRDDRRDVRLVERREERRDIRRDERREETIKGEERREVDRGRMGEAEAAGRVLLRGDGIERPLLNEPNEFIIDGSENTKEGRVTASLTGQKVDVPVRVTKIGPNIYKAVYTPLTAGKYELRVEWDGVAAAGSPLPITLASSPASAADLISVDSSTLKIGIINDDIKTLIDTRKAGPGQLSAQCMGPAKLAYCELYDHRDGTYTLSVKPTEVGKHTLTIKYNEKHVPGSPFLVHVSLPPDASKVRVYGPGIEHGILSIFKSNFVVETKGAGAGQLTVRVRGPKGAFNVEMQREKKNERTIHCKYEPREPGDYQVEVKWHGEHVPGSPFLVMIVDTETELSRFMRGEAPSPTPATPFIPPGWVGAPPPPLFHPHRGPPFYSPVGGPPPPGALIAPPFPHPAAQHPSRHRGKYANGL